MKVRLGRPCAFNYLFNPAHSDAGKAPITETRPVDHDPPILSLLSEQGR